MSQKWNIQDIRPVEPRKKRNYGPNGTKVELTTKREPAPAQAIPSIKIQNGTKKKKTGLFISFGIFIVVIIGVFAISDLMAGAEIIVNPQNSRPNVNAEFTAYPDKRSGELIYEIMTLDATDERQVKATGQKNVETQTKGVIEIIKTTPGAERLIKNTRFRSKNGLIFRIQESVVVPGAVKDSEGALVPGTIQAQVFAESAGEEYNLAAGSKFDIPGFEESGYTELFNAIYAENRESFTGGYNGPQFLIDENELQTARQELQIALRDQLLKRMKEEMPIGYVTFDESVAITYNQLPAVEYGQDLVTIKEQAVLQLPLFVKDKFASYIAQATIPGYEGNTVRIDNYDEIEFTYSIATTSNSNIANLTSLEFRLTGRPLIVYTFDEAALKADLLGREKTAITGILGRYPAIDQAKAVVRPFWKGTFPKDTNEITITEEIKK